MESAKEIINNLMSIRGLKRKRDVAKYFNVTPQALSIWIAKGKIPPKHLLLLSKEEQMEKSLGLGVFTPKQNLESQGELQTVIDYLMKENVNLKEKIKSLTEQTNLTKNLANTNGVFNKIIADSLYLSGRVSDGIITKADGNWKDIMGYQPDQLSGKKYDRNDLIHPDDLKAAKKIQQTLKNSLSISSSRYSAIQRWKHGESGNYIMLSMVWDINVNEDNALIVCKQIDGFISD